MRKTVVWSCDKNFCKYNVVSIKSFLQHNSGWNLVFYDVGLTDDQRLTLAKLGVDVRVATPDHWVHNAQAKIRIFSDVGHDEILLFLDSDTIVYDSVEPMVADFMASEKPIGLYPEGEKVQWLKCMAAGWKDSVTRDQNPEFMADFPHWKQWDNKPILNAGVILATHKINESGKLMFELYERWKQDCIYCEQTIISSVVRDRNIPYFPLNDLQHCLLWEEWMNHPGEPYMQAPLLDGKPVLIRHFCGKRTKPVLDQALPKLMAAYSINA